MKESYQFTGHQSFRNSIKGMTSLVISIIASFPVDEIPKIKQKFFNADYPHRYNNSVINNFQEKPEETHDFIIPLVSLMFQRRLYYWIYHTVQKMKKS